ncbi:MAG: response regulator transcription factor [Treponema sp.]|jgi:NarL family two-component system response regulator LiaR|nr:response regulator transcription factor [Treponema sp.]
MDSPVKDLPASILVIEDHPLTRHGLVACLEDTGRFSIAGTAGSLDEGRRFITDAPGLPDIIILDILLGGENGLKFIDFLKEFREIHGLNMPAVLVCSVFEDPFRIRTALQMGAAGYISKSAGEEELLRAIDTVLSGKEFVDPRLKFIISRAPGVYGKFTRREREILTLVKQNYTNQRIARELAISLRTVENHISHIYLKTNTSTRQELMEF